MGGELGEQELKKMKHVGRAPAVKPHNYKLDILKFERLRSSVFGPHKFFPTSITPTFILEKNCIQNKQDAEITTELQKPNKLHTLGPKFVSEVFKKH